MPVVLLAHCDGTNGSTTFTDTSASAHTLTPTAAAVATGNPKFGSGSASFTFSNLASSISVGGSPSDFWFDGLFTIEAWCYPTAAGSGDTYDPVLAEWDAVLGNVSFFFNVFPHMMFFFSTDGTAYDYVDSGSTLPLNTWSHVAVDRDASNVIRIYLNGVIVGAKAAGGAFFHSTYTCKIGNDASSARAFPGYLDEIRVTKGVAQYGGAFTPPIAAFPDPVSMVDLAGNLSV